MIFRSCQKIDFEENRFQYSKPIVRQSCPVRVSNLFVMSFIILRTIFFHYDWSLSWISKCEILFLHQQNSSVNRFLWLCDKEMFSSILLEAVHMAFIILNWYIYFFFKQVNIFEGRWKLRIMKIKVKNEIKII